jgi:hypothetical protein
MKYDNTIHGLLVPIGEPADPAVMEAARVLADRRRVMEQQREQLQLRVVESARPKWPPGQ